MKKCFKALAVWLILAVYLSVFLLPVTAVEPVYKVSEEYRSSPYYAALTECTLTGDGRYDVLTVAFSQFGYHEGDSEADMGGANLAGTMNFAEYNRIYGKLDNGEGNGVSYGYSWCAAFVSWCLRHAGVSKEVAKTEVSCRRMTDWYRENATFYPRSSGYTPQPGDIIMFHNGNGVAQHVGLVCGTEGNRVYVIDGNGQEGMVTTHSYRRGSLIILGYCVPDYETVEGVIYDEFMPETESPDAVVVAIMAAVLIVILAIAVIPVLAIVRARRQKMAEIRRVTETEDHK